MWGRMIFGKSSHNSLRRISLNSLKYFKDFKFSRSSVDHFPTRGLTCFHSCLGLNTWLQIFCSIKEVNFIDNFNIFWGHRQLFILDGLHLKQTWCKSVKGQYLFLPLPHPSVMCANPTLPEWHTHTWTQYD